MHGRIPSVIGDRARRDCTVGRFVIPTSAAKSALKLVVRSSDALKLDRPSLLAVTSSSI